MTELLGLVLDVVILICLGFTIYYALKLSRSLNNFRSYRADFEHLLDELTRNMEDAQRAIHNLRITSSDGSKNLQKILNESKSMADELQIINESANSQAERLEKLLGNASKSTATGKAYYDQVFKGASAKKK
jgi:methyl-accepting chemotaxis protein